MAVTRPGASLLTLTPRLASTVPTEKSVVRQVASFAVAVATDSGGGPAACAVLPNWMSVAICLHFTTPTTTTKIASASTGKNRNHRW